MTVVAEAPNLCLWAPLELDAKKRSPEHANYKKEDKTAYQNIALENLEVKMFCFFFFLFFMFYVIFCLIQFHVPFNIISAHMRRANQ